MVQYNNQTIQFGLDTTLTYVGFEINSFNNVESTIQRQVEDSLINGFDDISYHRWTNALLPGYAQLSLVREIDKCISLLNK